MKGMVAFVLALILLVLSLLGVAMRKVYYYLPDKELKRQAEGGDPLARNIWQAVSFGPSLRLYLWLWIGLFAAGGFVLLARVAPWPFGLIVIGAVIWLAFAWFPARISLTGFEARVANWITPAVSWQLQHLQPVFGRLAVPLVRRRPQAAHTNLYESADLIELLERQQTQPDNRIPKAELERAKRSLTAHHYKVGDLLVPRKNIKTVSDDDTIGLVLLDELHATGQSSFPVVKGKTDTIIGSLYLDDLGLKTEGKVRDYMQKDVHYLHEDDTLTEALQAIYKTKHQMFIAVNNFEEYVGIVTLEHILEHLAGDTTGDVSDESLNQAETSDEDDQSDETQIDAVTLESEESAAESEQEQEEEQPAEKKEPEADMQVVMNEEGEIEPADDARADSEAEPGKETEEPASIAEETEPVDTKGEGESETPEEDDAVNPDELAALDLPDDEAGQPEETDEGKHVTFEPKNPKPDK